LNNRDVAVRRLAVSTLLLLVASTAPAMAQGAGMEVDEPANMALFAIGIVGLIVGRRAARRKD
jgi:hypothetical protein